MAAPLYRFDGPIEPVRPSFLYLVGLAVTAFFMVLLPLLYMGVIAGVGYATYWHATHAAWYEAMAETARPRTRVWLFILGYLGPTIAGLFAVLFLVKPLIARSSRAREEPVTLDRSQEPLLYAFLEHLCEALCAPFPNRIDVSTIPNASASFRRGWVSFFSRDFALHLGLSLAAGMTLKQFAGVIAHELGHFSQGGAMRFHSIIRSMNGWLARIAYQRDRWDDQIDGLTRSGSGLVLLGYMVKLVVWLVRRVMILFYWIGHAISCSVSRQMEYNADQFEARLVGSAEFAQSTRVISELNVAMSIAIDRLQADWRAKRLVDNLPMLVAHTATALPDAAKEWIDKDLTDPRTGLFSTHPSPRKRIDAAERFPHPGVLHADGPAHQLFANFTMIANGVTLRYYRDVVELEVTAQNLIPVQQIAETHKAVNDHQLALGRYFQYCLSLSLPLQFGQSIEPATDPKSLVARLRTARAKFETSIRPLRKLFDRRRELIDRVTQLQSASAVARAKIKMNPKGWDRPTWSQESIADALSAVRAERSKLEEKIALGNRLVRARVVAALSLGRVTAISKRLDTTSPSPEIVASCLNVIDRIESVAGGIRRIDELGGSLAALFDHWTEEGPPSQYPLIVPVINSIQEELRHTLEDVRATLDDTPFPFDHAGDEMTSAEFLGPRLIPNMSPGDMFRMGQLVYGRVGELFGRSLGVIAAYAEAVENVIGLPPLPMPETPKKERPADEANRG